MLSSGHANVKDWLLSSALCCIAVLLLSTSSAFSQPGNPPSSLPVMRTIHDIFALSNAQAKNAYPIELEAVVTYSDPAWGLLFVQDSTSRSFIDVHGSNIVYPLGTRVRVRAVTDANENGNRIAHPEIVVLGHGTLPEASRKNVAELETGAFDSHRVVTEGVLHPCDRDWNRVCFRLYDGKHMLWLVSPEQESPASRSLIGATVLATGVAGRHESENHRRVGEQIFVNTLKDIRVESPAAPVSFSSPPTQIHDLLPSDADQRFVPKMHLRGTVTWQSPGLFSLQDNSGTLFVGTSQMVPVRSGSTVDAVGFLSHGPFGLQLSDSEVSLATTQSNASSIAPIQLSAAEIIRHSINGKRVRLKAHLIGQNATATEFVYQLEEGTQRFNAVLLRNDATNEIVGLSRDSILEVTGVALIQNGNEGRPDALLILIESPKDIVARGGIGWLTFWRGLIILGLMAACVLIPLIWVTVLRRTVRSQTSIIRARLESEMNLETKYSRLVERNLAAVFSWRPDGTIVDCNPAFAHMLGFESPGQVVGRLGQDFQSDQAEREMLHNALQEEAVSNQEVTLRRNDGAMLHLLMSITPVHTGESMIYETTAIDITQLKQSQAELQRAKDAAVFESLNDPLTGLPNRKLLSRTLEARLVEAQEESSMIALLYLDLDGFKLVNDSLGHTVGDALLVQVAARLRSWIRHGDMLARLGGDEFMVIMHRIHTRGDAVMLAENLLEEVSRSFEVKGHLLAIGASIGISVFPEDGIDAEELMQQADSAMYVGKREGKNRVTCFTPEIGSEVHERLTLEHLLRGAAARNEISLHYQPEFELSTSRLTRFEALARWTHPTLGQIPPLKFIPIAEESGLISALGGYILEQACIEALRWQKMMPYPIQVAVNVSSIQFRREGFVEEVRAILDRTGLRPELLQIEVTESVMMGAAEKTAETIDRFREMGISMAIDDFGTGYSSLSYLPTMAFDVLKIDRSFVCTLETQPETEAMFRTLIALAHNFGMKVIVEGVENERQLELTKDLGANEVQGYYTGRPTPEPMKYLLPLASVY